MPIKVLANGQQFKQTSTVKGSPISQAQINIAIEFIQAAKSANAPTNATLALITAGIYENSLGLGTYSHTPVRQGPLSPPVGSFPGAGLSQARQQAEAFLNGGPHFNNAIKASGSYPNTDIGVVQLAGYAEGGGANAYISGSNAQPSYPPSMIVPEARIILQLYGGATLASGGVNNDGPSTGTSINDTTPSGFLMGSTDSPDQDFWTTINQLAQDRQWYLFSDGETVYLADGPDLLQQDPVLTLDRWGNADRLLGLSFTWDNTAFQYTVNRQKPSKRVVRKSVLQKVQSPVQASLQVICDVDRIRGGDVIYLSNCGPGNGKWLVGDVTRSVMQVYSDCTLVPPMAPLTELEAAGSGNQVSDPSSSTSGSVLAAMISEANQISQSSIPYAWGGGHSQLGLPTFGSSEHGAPVSTVKGFDCSGSVSAVLGQAGLLQSPADTQGLIQALGKHVVRGRGTGQTYVTIWIDPAVHVFLEFNPGKDGAGPQYWGTSIGGGPSGRENGTPTGPTWWKAGTPAPDTQTFTPYHIPLAILSTPTNQPTKTQITQGVSPTNTMFDTASVSIAGDKNNFPAAPFALAGYMDGSFVTYPTLVNTFPAQAATESASQYSQVMSITVLGNPNADCLDIESGNPVPASGAGAWAQSALKAQGKFARPCVYASMDIMDEIKASLSAAGLARSQYRLWVADWGKGAHTVPGFDATQWTNGPHYDTSLLQANFFAKPGDGTGG